jgi:hypothetical protein
MRFIIAPLFALSTAGCVFDAGPSTGDRPAEAGVADFGFEAVDVPPCPAIGDAPVERDVVREWDVAPPRDLPVRQIRWARRVANVVLTPERDAAWIDYAGEGRAWTHAYLPSPREGVGVLPFFDGEDALVESSFVLVADGRAYPVYGSALCGEGLRLERAPRSDIGLRAPTEPTSDEEALARTVALRWMKTCPGKRSECALYGPPDDVAAAVDPAKPVGGWSLREVDVPEVDPLDRSGRLRHLPGWGHAGPEGRVIAHMAPADPTSETPSEHVVRIGFERGGQRVHAFDLPLPFEPAGSGPPSGAYREEDVIVVWTRVPDLVRLGVSVHDAETLERVEHHVVEAERYYEAGCLFVYTGTTPGVTFDDEGELDFTLRPGGPTYLYFEEPGQPAVERADPEHVAW